MNTDKKQRIDQVNQLIKTIGGCGRRFFFNEKEQRYATMSMNNRGHVFFNDDYTGERVYTHYRGRWRKFSHGGTMRTLVESFRDYITKGTPIKPYQFGPFPKDKCDGDLWSYGEDMEQVRQAAISIGLIPDPA